MINIKTKNNKTSNLKEKVIVPHLRDYIFIKTGTIYLDEDIIKFIRSFCDFNSKYLFKNDLDIILKNIKNNFVKYIIQNYSLVFNNRFIDECE